MEIKTFDLGTVLSVTTGTLLTKIDNVYKILDFMTGDSLFTHQLPRASDECAPIILKQYPQLTNINTDDVDTDNWKQFLKEQIKNYGNKFEIMPMQSNEHKLIDPISELSQMMNRKK